nr:DNA cytosine methyltransferase [uncultured Prevotella sp.]
MRNRYENIQNTIANIDDSGKDWRTFEFSHPERVIRLATSFSGIGAIEHSFHRLGLKCQIQFAGDIDADCKKTYFANYPIKEENWHADVHNFSATPYKGKVDLFVGGVPCQAFSLRGKHGGFEDTRGTLFREFARLVIECKPKVFIFENVKGMLSHDKGHTWKVIKETFEKDCDYDIYYQVLNGKNYGIPQSRERIFCIGFQRETDFKFPAPIPLQKFMHDFLQTQFDNKYFLKQKGVHFITETINHKKSYTQINGNIQLCQKRNQQFNWHGDFVFHPKLRSDINTPDTDNYLFKLSNYEEDYYKDKNPGQYAIIPLGKDKHVVREVSDDEVDCRYGRFRKLTPRECLRLMGFDDSFKIVVSDSSTYKQSGNSIIVNVLMAILKQLDITKYGTNV